MEPTLADEIRALLKDHQSFPALAAKVLAVIEEKNGLQERIEYLEQNRREHIGELIDKHREIRRLRLELEGMRVVEPK